MKKYICRAGLLILVAGLLSACGTKNEVNVSEELNSIESDQGQTSDGGELAKLLGVTSDKISYEAEGHSVNAQVDIPDVSKAAVYCQETYQMSADRVKDIATGLFDAGSLEAVRPFAAYSESELLEAEESLRKQALAVRKEARDAGRSDWAMDSRFFDCQRDDVKELLNAYEGEPKAWQENEFYETSDERKILIYQGSISGEIYFLAAVEQDEMVNLYLYKQGEPWCQNHNMYQNGWEERAIDELNDITSGRNQCMLSLEEAQKSAEAFLERYGLVDMMMVEAKDAVPAYGVFMAYEEENDLDYDYTSSHIPTGYSFHFVRSYEGIPLEYKDNVVLVSGNPWDVSEELQDESYQVVVNDEGVVYVSIGGMYHVTEVLADQSTLMSFEQINNIVKEQLPSISNGADIDYIDFRYKNVEYDGQIVLMPVWIYSAGQEFDILSGELRDNILVLNAVDGSVLAMDDIPTIRE